MDFTQLMNSGTNSPNYNNLQNQLAQLQSLYNQLTQNTQQYTQPSQPTTTASILWVDGIDGAKAYHMNPNTTAALFDKNDSVFYFRSLDANGVEAPIKIGRFVLEDVPEPTSDVITKKDLENFREEIRQMFMANQPQQSPVIQPAPVAPTTTYEPIVEEPAQVTEAQSYQRPQPRRNRPKGGIINDD